MLLEHPFPMTQLHSALEKVRELSHFDCGDTRLIYNLDEATGRVELAMFPLALQDQIETHRPHLRDAHEIKLLPNMGEGPAPYACDPLVHLKIKGTAYVGGFAAGATMRGAPDAENLKFQDQNIERDGEQTTVVTRLESATTPGLRVEHRLWWFEGEGAVRVQTTVENAGEASFELEFLTSFSLGAITPFAVADAPRRLHLHRFKSWWSAEARLLSQRVEALGLEPAWAPFAVRVERFGQVGSMPVRGWFPFAALEDREVGVFWGAQIGCPGSWQIEVARRGDFLALSGGGADREFGQWSKIVAPGHSYASPIARLACVAGTLEDLCDRLVNLGRRPLLEQPASERAMPLVCNDWCTNWGQNTHGKIMGMARRLEGTPVKYLVIDDGWQRVADGGMQQIGDWNLNRDAFPGSVLSLSRELRELGFVPGIWFEFENCSSHARAWQESEHFLARDGVPLQVGGRRFWDFRDPWVAKYLGEKVVDFLRDNEIGYLKVDYNDTIGVGCDGAESPGEGLRAHLQAVQEFFALLRRELPDLVIETCSSGGHRLEPSFLELCAQASFSDAHESLEIPIIAANLHRLMLPQQNQIWAVLHAGDSRQRLIYSLAAGFLGRLCISGEIADLSEQQMAVMTQALEFYPRVAPFIRDGVSRSFGPEVVSFRHPQGWQMVRYALDAQVLIVAHGFADGGAAQIELPAGNWKVSESFGDTKLHIEGTAARAELGEWSGAVWLLEKA